jgi:hypothetical protein
MIYGTPILDRGLFRLRRRIKQSNVLLVSDNSGAIEGGIESILRHRSELEAYIQRRPGFALSLEPLTVEESAPEVVRLASFAAEVAQVGPMAAVPGALAQLAARDMASKGARVSLVENGGEIAAVSTRPLIVGIYAGASSLSNTVGFHLTVEDFPVGISTSSATVGHALSLGEADAAVVVANTASVADAAATAVGNCVIGDDVETSIRCGLWRAKNISGVRGAVVIRGNHMGIIGRLPKLIGLDGSRQEMFRASLL